MNNIVKSSDFNKELGLDLVKQGQLVTFNDFVAIWQEKLLKELLGDDLYCKMEDSFSSELWSNFINGETLTLNNLKWKFAGCKPMLKYFIWYEFQRDAGFDDKDENNAKIDRALIKNFNRGVDYYYDCVRYLLNDTVNFPNLIYYEKEKKHNSIIYG